ncbi:hypothetical protein QTP88_025862 [Uroleucon formosanum]
MRDDVLQFRSALPKVIEALTIISKWADRNSSSKASILLAAISNGDFIISLLSTTDILKLTLPVFRLLQSTSLDFASASSVVEGIKEIFQEKRAVCISEFHTIFLNASSLAEEIGCDIKMPRIAKTQIHRVNYPATDAEQFYLRSIYVPLLLDAIKSDITNRLSTETLEAFNLRLLIPSILVKLNDTDGWDRQKISKRIIAVAKKFSLLFTVSEHVMVNMLEGEICLWLHKWKQQLMTKRPCTALESYMHCNEDVFSTIKKLLQILSTLPVSVASAEKSFSTLRKLKTWLRSRMSEDRLSALCLLNVYNKINILHQIDNIIDIFANLKNRRLEFVL